MTPANSYEIDARWIASELQNIKETAANHRKDLIETLKAIADSLEDWKEEARQEVLSLHGRVSVLEESKGTRNTLLLLAGGAIGTFLTLLGKHFGI